MNDAKPATSVPEIGERERFEVWFEGAETRFDDDTPCSVSAWDAWQARASYAAPVEARAVGRARRVEPVAQVGQTWLDNGTQRFVHWYAPASEQPPPGTKLYAAPVAATEAVEWQTYDSSNGWLPCSKATYEHYAKFGVTRRSLAAIETHDPAGNLPAPPTMPDAMRET